MNDLNGNPKYYKNISYLLFACFILIPILIFILNLNKVEVALVQEIGLFKYLLLEAFFWGALGATISSSLFMAKDKDLNELEEAKEQPDPTNLRYPNLIDVFLYMQRIFSSGLLAVVGLLVIYLPMSIPRTDDIQQKTVILFMLGAFLIGMFQEKFIVLLKSIYKKVFN